MTKLLITLLTSSNIDYLKATYTSVKNQMECNIDFKIIIVVNTLNKDYYSQVNNYFKEAEVVETESNGFPGKGHNSLFKIFNQYTDYEYLLPLDGDDFLYPCALKKLGIYLNYKPDILMLPFTDNINNEYQPNVLHYPFINKCYLYFNNYLKSFVDTWRKNKLSPFENHIGNLNTPGRLLLCSRKSLEMNLSYDENLKWFDDYYIFLQIFEASIINNRYNIYMLDDRDIYLYNRLNENSITQEFKNGYNEKIIIEEKIFRNSIYNKFLSIRDWDLNKLIFLTSDECSDFNLKDKINFAEQLIDKILSKNTDISKNSIPLFIKYSKENNYPELEEIYKSLL